MRGKKSRSRNGEVDVLLRPPSLACRWRVPPCVSKERRGGCGKLALGYLLGESQCCDTGPHSCDPVHFQKGSTSEYKGFVLPAPGLGFNMSM